MKTVINWLRSILISVAIYLASGGPMKRKGKIEYYVDAKGEHRWRLRAANGKIIAASTEGYVERRNAQLNVKAIKEQLTILCR